MLVKLLLIGLNKKSRISRYFYPEIFVQIRTFYVQASSSGRLSVGMCLAWDPESQVRYGTYQYEYQKMLFTATLFAVVRYNTMELGIYTVPKAKGIHGVYIESELRRGCRIGTVLTQS